jgi:hypothetical protein
VVTRKKTIRVGTKVVFQLGDHDVDATVIDVWNDEHEHVRVEYYVKEYREMLLTVDDLRIA